MRRRRLDPMEVQQMKAQAKEEKARKMVSQLLLRLMLAVIVRVSHLTN